MTVGRSSVHNITTAGPLVTIAIPTYNRAHLLRRSISSAMAQTYRNIEIIVSDNASTDATSKVVRDAMHRDGRVRYERAARNNGAVQNFVSALSHANGEYFMWLGDDDWIDSNYVEAALLVLEVDPDVVLVGGRELYYRAAAFSHQGRLLNLLSDNVWRRLISYHWQVRDNGVFYGLMRTSAVRETRPDISLAKFAGDQFVVAALAARGKVAARSDAAIHRELGGASASYRAVAAAANKSPIFAIFPHTTVAISACIETANYKNLSIHERVLVASAVLVVIMLRSIAVYSSAVLRKAGRILKNLGGSR